MKTEQENGMCCSWRNKVVPSDCFPERCSGGGDGQSCGGPRRRPLLLTSGCWLFTPPEGKRSSYLPCSILPSLLFPSATYICWARMRRGEHCERGDGQRKEPCPPCSDGAAPGEGHPAGCRLREHSFRLFLDSIWRWENVEFSEWEPLCPLG